MRLLAAEVEGPLGLSGVAVPVEIDGRKVLRSSSSVRRANVEGLGPSEGPPTITGYPCPCGEVGAGERPAFPTPRLGVAKAAAPLRADDRQPEPLRSRDRSSASRLLDAASRRTNDAYEMSGAAAGVSAEEAAALFPLLATLGLPATVAWALPLPPLVELLAPLIDEARGEATARPLREPSVVAVLRLLGRAVASVGLSSVSGAVVLSFALLPRPRRGGGTAPRPEALATFCMK